MTLLSGYAYLVPFSGWWAMLLWGVLAAGILAFVWRYRAACRPWGGRAWSIFAILFLMALIFTLWPGLRLSGGTALVLPELPQDDFAPALMFFAALPWVMAAGLLNPCSAFFLGLWSGLLRAFWDTHNPFTPLIMAGLAFLFALSIQQNYRTRFYRWLRQPVLAIWALLPFYVVLTVLGAFSVGATHLATGLDYALSNIGIWSMAFIAETVIAALIAQIIKTFFPTWWKHPERLEPAPTERSLERRFVLGMGLLSFLLLAALLAGDWIVAGRAARVMLRDRLESTANVAADIVPYFLETGQNLALRIAGQPGMATDDADALRQILSEQMLYMPYFDELLVYDAGGNLLAAYPSTADDVPHLQLDEINGITLALNGVMTQVYTIPPAAGRGAARVSFLVLIQDAQGVPTRVLIGRSSLDTNPLVRPLLNGLRNVGVYEGTAFLLDERNQVLFDSSSGQSMYSYPGRNSDDKIFYEDLAPDGTRRLVYYRPTVGRDWAVVLTVPAQVAQQLALQIATPLSLILLVLVLFAMLLLRLTLRSVTGSLHRLSEEANLIARGDLGHAVTVGGVDELGRLGQAFEQMRVSLKARLDELNRLLVTSQKMASSLEIGPALQPILEAARATGASAVRVALLETTLPDILINQPLHYALGREEYAYLDQQLLELMRNRERIFLTNVRRASVLSLSEDKPVPDSLLALPLQQKNRYYGLIWLAYDARSHIDDADIRFLATLAGQASLAVANAVLFLEARVGRQHLEAILSSTPDPVLVTDSSQRLILANPSAAAAFGIDFSQRILHPVSEIFDQPAVLDLLTHVSDLQRTLELNLPNGKTYLATASSVTLTGGQMVGRVCILRDVTYLKEMDAMKSEFVSTVSHDLRSPLTLMRGYATMLEMVGDLNEQQRSYARKIVVGVENMSRLVNNLLDLGRIEAGVGLNREKVSVLTLVSKIIGDLQLYSDQKEIDLVSEIEANAPQTVEADSALLYQAVYNLVENALKYTPEKGRVVLRVFSQSERLVFAIQDTGIGISEKDQKHLFEKFFRSSAREARQQKGTGLGLAIVRSIAERHGGQVWVESKLGEGSTFYFAVPLGGASDD